MRALIAGDDRPTPTFFALCAALVRRLSIGAAFLSRRQILAARRPRRRGLVARKAALAYQRCHANGRRRRKRQKFQIALAFTIASLVVDDVKCKILLVVFCRLGQKLSSRFTRLKSKLRAEICFVLVRAAQAANRYDASVRVDDDNDDQQHSALKKSACSLRQHFRLYDEACAKVRRRAATMVDALALLAAVAVASTIRFCECRAT